MLARADNYVSALKDSEARWYPLIEHAVQRALVTDPVRFKVVPAGRRCLEAGTLVATPGGPVPIEALKVGDEVIGFEDDEPRVTNVTAVWENGEQEVAPLHSGGRKFLAATASHKLWACNEKAFDKRRETPSDYDRFTVSDITKRHRVRRAYAGDLIRGGSKRVPLAYALGALLGDGCSRNNRATTGLFQRTLHISAETAAVPARIGELMGCGYRRTHPKNYTWAIDTGRGALDSVPFYREWAAGRYAHQKLADWNEIDTWDRESALQFLAGVVDTDGSIYYKNQNKKEAVINIGMQASSVVECCAAIVFKYFQEPLCVRLDDRNRYKNGPVWSAKTTSNLQVITILSAIEPYLRHRAGFDISTLRIRNVRHDRIGLLKGKPYRAKTYDITVGNDTNLYCLHEGGVVTSNSGKSERAKRFLAREALRTTGNYFIAAPTHDQVRRIYWDDIKLLCFTGLLPKGSVSEVNLTIRLPNGSMICLLGLDKPERIEGFAWDGGIIDEIADCKATAWSENVGPALDTVNPTKPLHRAWCWLIGVPDGLNHYYDLAEYARTSGDNDWRVYHWKSSEILPVDVIEAAKRRMSLRQFRQEYEASFEGATGRIYEDYSDANVTREEIAPHEQLMWMHDFNYTPLSSAIAVRRGNSLYVLDEIVLESAVAKQTAVEFCDRYQKHENKTVLLYGDPAGQAGEKHGQVSNYTAIIQQLRESGWTVDRRVKPAAPAIRDRQNAVRAKICNAAGQRSLFCNPNRAPYAHKGLATVQIKAGSSFIEEVSQYQHITTAIGYCVDREWPVLIDTTVPKKIVTPVASVSHYSKGMSR